MPRCRSISLFVTLLAALCFRAPAAEPSPWLEVHSVHYTVITDAGEKKGREVVLRFEQMRAVFATLIGKDRLNQSVPLTIFAFNNDKAYYQAAPLYRGQPITAAGFFLPGDDQDFIALNLAADQPWRDIAHEFATMLLSYNYPPAQGWFDEGLAEYFGSIRLDNKQVELGADPELRDSPQNVSGDSHPKFLSDLLGAKVWLALPDLFTVKHDASAANEGSHHTLYYAESWIVIHYLLHEQKLPQTGTYFGLVLNQHVPVEEAIQQAFGVNADQLENAVKDYFHSQAAQLTAIEPGRQTSANPQPGQAYRFPVPVGPDDSAITSKPLIEADARAMYAELQTRVPERREAGLKTLHELAEAPTAADKKAEAKQQAKSPSEDSDQLPTNAIGNVLAHRILAWDHIQHGEFSEAANEIKDASVLNPSDMWLRYYVAVLRYRGAEAGHTEIQGLANMMLDLRAVLEWYPEFASAYDLLAVARNAGGGPAAALQAERAAIGLSPRNELYSFHLAQIYVASKKWEAANALLDRLKASSNPQIAARARDLLEQAGTERKYGIPVKAGAITQPQLAPQKSPFDVLDEDAAKREAAEHPTESAAPEDTRPTKFLKGRLVAVDCSHSPAAILTVTDEGATLKLRTANYKSMVLIGADDFSCDWRDRRVTVNYKPAGSNNGDVVSLEVR